MKPTVVNSYAQAATSAVASDTVVLPTSVAQVGDLLCLYQSTQSAVAAAMPTDDSGGTWVREQSGGFTARLDVFVRPVTSNDLDGTTITFATGDAGSAWMSAVLVVVRGAAAPPSSSPHTKTTLAGTTAFNHPSQPISTGYRDALLLYGMAGYNTVDGPSGHGTTPAEVVELQDIMSGTDGSGARLAVQRFDFDTTTPGSFGAYTLSFQASRSFLHGGLAFIAPITDRRSPAPTTKVETFTASDTFTLDPRAREVIVQAIGGGGGGGSGRRGAAATVRQGGAGGGGGAYSQATFKAANLTSTVAVIIGAGGAGGAAQTVNDTDGVNGASGGTSSFGTVLSAVGGNFGASGKATGTPAGGAATTGPQTDPGGVGNSANSTGTISASQATIASSRGPSGGGAGGGLTSANATSSGRSTGPHGVYDNAQPSNAGGSTISGTIGVTYHGLVGSGGGGGGSGSAAAAAGSGGDGGLYGGGAGGGGGSLNGFDSGKGGNGGPGVVRVITIY